MSTQEDGGLAITVSLKTGHDYRFRYLLNSKRWKNDWAAVHDKYKYSNKYSTIEQNVLIRQFRCFIQGGGWKITKVAIQGSGHIGFSALIFILSIPE